MKSRQPFDDHRRQAADILETLAAELPDHILRECFKDLSPEQVRKVLTGAGQILAPRHQMTSPVQSQTLLWQEGNKDWSGKLAGETLQLFSDGASRGNPGRAGAGIVILDCRGFELVGAAEYLGRCTNNEAEYRALLLGLKQCAQFGRGRLVINLDSELVVKQIQGKYKVKHPNLRLLHRETMQQLEAFDSYTVKHIRREKNRRADELANRAIDEHLR